MCSMMYSCIKHEPHASSISTDSKEVQQMGRIYKYSDVIFLQEEVDFHRSNCKVDRKEMKKKMCSI